MLKPRYEWVTDQNRLVGLEVYVNNLFFGNIRVYPNDPSNKKWRWYAGRNIPAEYSVTPGYGVAETLIAAKADFLNHVIPQLTRCQNV